MLFLSSGGRRRLLCTAASNGPIVQPPDKMIEHIPSVQCYWQRKTKGLGENLVPVPFGPLKIPHSLPWDRGQASAVRSRQLAAPTSPELQISLNNLCSLQRRHYTNTHTHTQRAGRPRSFLASRQVALCYEGLGSQKRFIRYLKSVSLFVHSRNSTSGLQFTCETWRRDGRLQNSVILQAHQWQGKLQQSRKTKRGKLPSFMLVT